MGRLKAMPPRLRPAPERLRQPPKVADTFYHTPEWAAARKAALKRADYRCEAIENGLRCRKCSRAGDRMFVDHIVERKDGGPDLDLRNLQVLCGSHHTAKTADERRKRMTR
jgi:5-methylcytosine-specific restriction endonuclease McrA